MITTSVKRPAECSEIELQSFESLALKGGEVKPKGLAARIRNAFSLGIIFDEGQMIAVAAVKVPSRRHAITAFTKAGARESPDHFTCEYGWAFTEINYRKQGHATRLLKLLLNRNQQVQMFATTRADNSDIHVILKKNGFSSSGKPYLGDRGKMLILWTRKQRI